MASFSSCSGVIGKDSGSLAKRPQKSLGEQHWLNDEFVTPAIEECISADYNPACLSFD